MAVTQRLKISLTNARHNVWQEALQIFLSSWQDALVHMATPHQNMAVAAQQLKALRQTFSFHLVMLLLMLCCQRFFILLVILHIICSSSHQTESEPPKIDVPFSDQFWGGSTILFRPKARSFYPRGT